MGPMSPGWPSSASHASDVKPPAAAARVVLTATLLASAMHLRIVDSGHLEVCTIHKGSASIRRQRPEACFHAHVMHALTGLKDGMKCSSGVSAGAHSLPDLRGTHNQGWCSAGGATFRAQGAACCAGTKEPVGGQAA